MTPTLLAAAQVHEDHVRRPHQRLDHAARGHEHSVGPQAHRQIAVLTGDQPPLRELPAALRHAAGDRTRRHDLAGASAWWATSPPTIVSAARPVSVRPAKGVLRLFEKNAAGSTVQCAVTSSTTTSAARPGCKVPAGSRNAAANAVSSPMIPKGASSKAASLAS